MLARFDAESLFMSKFFGSTIDQTDYVDMGDEMLKDGWVGEVGWRGRAGGRERGREGGREGGREEEREAKHVGT
jgi:hypothetical protein